jgi:hypothetical protein
MPFCFARKIRGPGLYHSSFRFGLALGVTVTGAAILAMGCGVRKADTSLGSGGPGGTAGGAQGGSLWAGGSDGGSGGTAAGAQGGNGGTGGNGGAPASCGAHEPLGPRLWVRTLGTPGGVYDGSAVVERSTVDDLVLYFVAATGAMHATITGWRPMPILPVGAQVWLSKSPAGDQAADVLQYGIYPWALSVRDLQGGHLLFGATRNFPGSEFDPIAKGTATATCTAPNPDFCARTTSVTYSEVELLGDLPVTVRDGETAIVQIDGIEYDASVTAQYVSLTTTPICADWHPGNGIALDIQARDLASLTRDLATGGLPACVEGNDRRLGAFIDFDRTYEGPVFFSRRNPNNNDYLFETGGISTGAALFSLSTDAGVFAEPTVGQEFWLSTAGFGVAVLRKANRGELVLAHFSRGAPIDATDGAAIAVILDIAVSTEQNCVYAPDMPVWDIVFGTTPPVRVKSGSTGTLRIEGKDFNVSATAMGRGASFTIFPQ